MTSQLGVWHNVDNASRCQQPLVVAHGSFQKSVGPNIDPKKVGLLLYRPKKIGLLLHRLQKVGLLLPGHPQKGILIGKQQAHRLGTSSKAIGHGDRYSGAIHRACRQGSLTQPIQSTLLCRATLSPIYIYMLHNSVAKPRTFVYGYLVYY